MTLLEIIAGGGEALKIAFAVQRGRLKEDVSVVSVDVSTMSGPSRLKFLKSLSTVRMEPDAVLLRGIEFLPHISKALNTTPIYIDHCTPVQLGRTSPLRRCFGKQIQRVYVYSERAERELRYAGHYRVTPISGPAIPTEKLPSSSSNGVPKIAFLDTCSKSQQVLSRVLKIQEQQGWKFKAVSPMPSSKVTRVTSNLEAVEAADFVVSSYEDVDFGQPHEGAILAHSVGRPMTTARTLAFSIMGFPSANFIPALKHQIGTYAAAVGVYLRDRDKFEAWVDDAGPDPYTLPEDLLSRMA